MLNLKKTALAVIALGSTAAFAGTMGPVCSAVNVTVPCETCAWDFGGRALYLQPTSLSSFANYYNVQTNSTDTLNNKYNNGLAPTFGWGFQLEASYHYSTGNDVNVNWYHFRNGKAVNPIKTTTLVSLPSVTGTSAPNSYTVNNLAASANPAWDQVNIEVGQHVDFGENKFARLHGGFNYSRFGVNGFENFYGYSGTTVPTATTDYINRTDSYTSVFNGFGPRVGMDLNYEWGNGLGVYANGALSVLAGSSKTSLNRNNWSNPNQTFTISSSRNNVVGELDTKVGFMYTYACAQGDLSLDVGWLFAAYNGGVWGIDNIDLGGVNGSQDNWGIQGLYFGAKWVGNVA
jgi:hypothetical protein